MIIMIRLHFPRDSPWKYQIIRPRTVYYKIIC